MKVWLDWLNTRSGSTDYLYVRVPGGHCFLSIAFRRQSTELTYSIVWCHLMIRWNRLITHYCPLERKQNRWNHFLPCSRWDLIIRKKVRSAGSGIHRADLIRFWMFPLFKAINVNTARFRLALTLTVECDIGMCIVLYTSFYNLPTLILTKRPPR
jgi:hypothetical protein